MTFDPYADTEIERRPYVTYGSIEKRSLSVTFARPSSAGLCRMIDQVSYPAVSCAPPTPRLTSATWASARAAAAPSTTVSTTTSFDLSIRPLHPIMRRPPAHRLMSTED